MFEIKSKAQNLNEDEILENEFFLEEGEVKEVRCKVGKYNVYEPTIEFYEYMGNKFTESMKGKEIPEGKVAIDIDDNDDLQMTSDLYRMLTDIPEKIINVEMLRKMNAQKRKKTQLLANITLELNDIVEDYMNYIFGKTIQTQDKTEKITSKMSPKAKKAYFELMEVKANKVVENVAIDLESEKAKKEVEELEAKLAEMKEKLNK